MWGELYDGIKAKKAEVLRAQANAKQTAIFLQKKWGKGAPHSGNEVLEFKEAILAVGTSPSAACVLAAWLGGTKVAHDTWFGDVSWLDASARQTIAEQCKADLGADWQPIALADAIGELTKLAPDLASLLSGKAVQHEQQQTENEDRNVKEDTEKLLGPVADIPWKTVGIEAGVVLGLYGLYRLSKLLA